MYQTENNRLLNKYKSKFNQKDNIHGHFVMGVKKHKQIED